MFCCEFSAYDVIALTEVWLSDCIPDCEIPLKQYQIFRKDRSSRGGGVLLLVHEKWTCVRRHDLEDTNEAIWVQITTNVCKFLVCCFYSPPKEGLSPIEKLFETVFTITKHHPVIITGDFNLHIQWQTPTIGVCSDSSDRWFYDHFVSGLGLKQFVTFPTRRNNTLDYILSSFDNVRALPGDNFINSDHGSVHAEIAIERPGSTFSPHTRKHTYMWKKVNWSEMAKVISNLPWCLLETLDVDSAVEFLEDTVSAAIKDFVPVKKVKTSRFPHWYSQETKLTLKNKKSAWLLWKQLPMLTLITRIPT